MKLGRTYGDLLKYFSNLGMSLGCRLIKRSFTIGADGALVGLETEGLFGAHGALFDPEIAGL